MKKQSGFLSRLLGVVLAAAGMLLTAQQAGAQTGLNTMNGLTETQLSVANAINTLCPGIAGTSNSNGTQAQRFAASCTKLVASLNNFGGVLDLDLTNNQIKEAMNHYGGKENVGTGSVATNSPGTNGISSRLLQLHQGATGFNLAESGFSIDGRRVSLAQLTGRRGGSSGDDALTGAGWGGFVNATYATGEKDTTNRETGFEFDAWNLSGGVDYRLSDNVVGGVALSWAKVDSDFDVGLGSSKDNVLSLSVYGTFYVRDAFYLDAHAGYSRHSFDTSRRIVVTSNNANPGLDATATSDGVGGDQFTAFVGGGHSFAMGATTVTPFVNLAYLHLSIDDFTETEPVGGMALNVQKQSLNSLQSALGARVSHAISTGSGVFVPTAHVSFVHEFANKSRSITARFINDPLGTSFAIPTESPDRNFFTAGLGASAVFGKGWTGFVSYDTVIGLQDVSTHIFSGGVRAEW